MGSSSVYETSYGSDSREAYMSAVAKARDYYGHRDGYSGGINSTEGFREIRLPEGMNYGTKKFESYIEKLLGKLGKGDCVAIELPRKMWRDKKVNEISGVESEDIITKGTRQWVTVYSVYAEDINDDSKFRSRMDKKLVKELSTKGDAIKYGKVYSKKYGVGVRIEVSKKLTGASPVVANIKPKYKQVTEKEKAYLFIGWASS